MFFKPGGQREGVAKLGDIHNVLASRVPIVETVDLVHADHMGLRPAPWNPNEEHGISVLQPDLVNLKRHPRLDLVPEQVFNALFFAIDIDADPALHGSGHAAGGGDADDEVAADAVRKRGDTGEEVELVLLILELDGLFELNLLAFANLVLDERKQIIFCDQFQPLIEKRHRTVSP